MTRDQYFIELEVLIKDCVVHNVNKHGKEFTINSLREYIEFSSLSGFTRDKHVRNSFEDIDKKRLMYLIKKIYSDVLIKDLYTTIVEDLIK